MKYAEGKKRESPRAAKGGCAVWRRRMRRRKQRRSEKIMMMTDILFDPRKEERVSLFRKQIVTK